LVPHDIAGDGCAKRTKGGVEKKMSEETNIGDLERIRIRYPEEPKCPLVLLLDVSGSMGQVVEGKQKIEELNAGVKTLKDELTKDSLAAKRVEVGVVTFGDADEVKVFSEFTAIENFSPAPLVANGSTPMGNAILKGIDLIAERKSLYNERGINYYRPWIWLVTDGMPTDMSPNNQTWNKVIDAVHRGEKEKKFVFFAVGVEGADLETLRLISPPNRVPVTIKGVQFKEMFTWLSRSMKQVSASKAGAQVKLEPAGWAEV
jgi:uncharacterized protein YegL